MAEREAEIAAMADAIQLQWNGANAADAQRSGNYMSDVASRYLARTALRALEKVRGGA